MVAYLGGIHWKASPSSGLACSSRLQHPARATRAVLGRLLWLCATAADDCYLPRLCNRVKGQKGLLSRSSVGYLSSLFLDSTSQARVRRS